MASKNPVGPGISTITTLPLGEQKYQPDCLALYFGF